MRQIFLLIALVILAIRLPVQADESPKLALIVESAEASTASDLLTAQLSSDTKVRLLERNDIQKVYQEQALSAGNKDYLKLGQTVGADGLLILKLVEKDDRQLMSCRLVAVKPGVDLGTADYDFPLSDPENWSKLVAGQFVPLLPKLTVLRQDAVPVSILNLRSAVASAEGNVLERQLTLLLHDRLTTERDLFVLERRNMESLTFEKEEMPASESPFWNGSYLVEGTIDPGGFNSNQVTVNVQITPPEKKPVITLEASGARSNLTQVINDMALRIAAAVNKGGLPSTWNAGDEAERYFQEANWMFRWHMFQEAKAASEAAWALGKQTRDSAELRVKAYQACAGDPGLSRMMNDHVIFIRPPKEGILGLNGYDKFASAPTAAQFPANLRAAELWLDGVRNFALPDNKIDSSWYNLGATNLEQSSWWLRYFYFNAEARGGMEDDIGRGRQLCREMFQALAGQAQGAQAKPLFQIFARHQAFWSETPEDTLRTYRAMRDNGQWPAVRERFLNDTYKEVSALRQKQGYTFTTGHQASGTADVCSPCLAGWDWQTRQRCPQIWNSFIDDTCASPKPLVQLEGLILRCSYAWSDADFKSNLSRLEDFIRQQMDAIAAAGLQQKLATDLKTMVDLRREGFDGQDAAMDESWANCQRELEASANKSVQAEATQAKAKVENADLKAAEEYLRTKTNFDFMSFTRIVLNKNFDDQAAKVLLPLVTNYQERINRPENAGDNPHAKADRIQSEFWIKNLEAKLKGGNSQPTVVTSRMPPTHPLSGPVGSAYRLNGRANGSVLTQNPLSSIKSVRFWKMPEEKTDNPEDARPGYVTSACCRDGRLWVQELYRSADMSGSAEFYGVDLKTFDARHVAFRGDQFSFWAAVSGDGENRFEVDSNYLYLWLKDSVRRYSFKHQAWEVFAAAGDGRPQRLGNRLFFTSANSIQEYLPDGTIQLLASCRRRPAVTALDNLDHYDPCHLFLDAKGRLNVYASYELYALTGPSNWEHYGTVPSKNASAAQLFDDGVIQPLFDGWWGMLGPSQKPELLFRSSSAPRRSLVQFRPAGSQEETAPRWRGPAPTEHACPDGDCVWFLADPSMPTNDGSPGGAALPSRRGNGLSLVRYKYDEPNPILIAFEPSQQDDAISNSSHYDGPFWENAWKLTAAPEGLVAIRRAATGFWFISREDLNRAVAEAYSHRHANP